MILSKFRIAIFDFYNLLTVYFHQIVLNIFLFFNQNRIKKFYENTH